MDSYRRASCGVKSKWVLVRWLSRDEGVKNGEEIRPDRRRRRRERAWESMWEERRRWRMREMDWWLWCKALLSSVEEKRERDLIGGSFTRFGRRGIALLVYGGIWKQGREESSSKITRLG